MPENEFPKLVPHPFKSAASRAGDAPSGMGTLAWRADALHDYAELAVTSNYTFLTGASHPEELVRRAAELGYKAVALTDTHSLAGVVRAHVAAREAGIQFVLGARLRPRDMPGLSLLVYPSDFDAYKRLCRVLTLGKRRAPKGQCHLDICDIAAHSAGMLAVVMPDLAGAGAGPNVDLPSALARLREIFDDDRLSLAASMPYGPDDAGALASLARVASEARVPLVATNDAHHHIAERRMLQDVLTCIRHTCTLSEAGFRLHASAERHLKPPSEMHRLFASHPAAIERALEIASRCRGCSLDQLRYEYPDEVVPAGATPMSHLTNLAWLGAAERYPGGVPEKVRVQIEHELALIADLNYAPYFLTVHDLVVFARGRGILCQGRGAAANSAVCYCLGVTAVDPARIDVLFERFISKERNEPPDIDIDFEHERREEVIQYLYAKYGRERAALTAEVITYRRRSAVRDVGKALGLSLDLVDRLAKDIEWFDPSVIDESRWREMGLNPADRTMRWLAELTTQILGFPRHLSQHVGGFIITRTPLCELVPVENAAMPDRTVVEWDKDDVDAVGMLKIDVLGLGMLTCIRKAMGMVNERGSRSGQVAEWQGGDAVCTPQKEHSDDADQNLSRSTGVAEGDGDHADGVSRDIGDARFGAVRAHVADATLCIINPVEYRGGMRPAHDTGVSAWPSHCARFSMGTLDRDRDRHVASHVAAERCDRVDAGGGGPHDPKPYRQAAGTDRASAEKAVASDRESRAHDATGSLSDSATSPLCHSATSLLIELHTIPPEDPATYAMIQRADTVGVFQIESRAQMSMLPRLKPACFYDLVIEVAIVRPGPIQGDMVHPYLRRRNGEEQPEYASPEVREVLEKTLGVPLFQEQCMALAVKAAGFTPGEADQLRRAMAAWKRKSDLIYRYGQKLMDGMIARGIEPEFAHRCFEQIKGFSEYGFPESHAASFALLVYASSWLKCHYPAQFAAALLNSQPMGFYAPAQIVRDAKEHGVDVRPVDIARSQWDCTIEYGAGAPATDAVRLGMRLVSGVSQRDADKIAAAVRERGVPPSLLALWRRSGAKASAIRKLAAADAMCSMNLTRQEALWQSRLLRDAELPLFDAADERAEPSPALPRVAPARQVVLDYVSTGLSLKAHPVSFDRARLDELGVTRCGDLKDPQRTPQGEWVRVAGLVLVRQRPGTAGGVTFITLEDETGIVNLIIWQRVYREHRRVASRAMLVAEGRVQREGLVVHVIVQRLAAFDHVSAGLAFDSRNFR
jgi:error-prone DNA polymerase